jgi:hypothetical protein
MIMRKLIGDSTMEIALSGSRKWQTSLSFSVALLIPDHQRLAPETVGKSRLEICRRS